jgi:dihydrolipoamide dehydrogenase
MKYAAVVIGGGPAGYVAAIRMGQLGFKVALIEEKELGGTCLNWGCVPTKALYSATRLLEQARTAAEMGILFSSPRIDLPKLAAWKEGVSANLATGIEKLLRANGVTVIKARGRLDGLGRVALPSGDIIEAERIVLATGSTPLAIAGFSLEEELVWSSDDALALAEIPERLLVIGGGVIGLELATIYNRLGSAVTVIEMMPELLPGIDLDRRVLSTLKRSLSRQGITAHTNTPAVSFKTHKSGVTVYTQGEQTFEADRVLLSVGRRPNTANLGLEAIGVELDQHGFVIVDKTLRTTTKGVYAIGDLVPGPMLAHKASAEGIRLAESFVGETIPLDYDTIPQAIFTDPEIACVGLSESTAKERGGNPIVGRFPYASLGKAQGMCEPEGFFQIVADAKTGRILGAQIVGAEASDLISEAALAVQKGLTLSDIANTVHPHPTLPEGLKEAAENALGRAIHTTNH